MHLHGMGWCTSQPTPETLRNALAADQSLTARFCALMDSVIRSDFRPYFDVLPQEISCVFVPDLHPSVIPGSDPSDSEPVYQTDFNTDYATLGPSILCHDCKFSDKCTRGSCAYNYPMDLTDETAFTDAGELVFQRNNGFSNGNNPLITSVLRCNTDVKQLVLGGGGLARWFYMSKYMSKNEAALGRYYAISAAAVESYNRWRNTSDPVAKQALDMIRSCCNRVGAEMELPHVVMAYILLFNRDHNTNARFRNLFTRTFMARIAAQEQAVQSMDNDVDEHAELVSVSADVEDQLVETNNVDEYIFRGDALESMCLYLYTAHFQLVSRADDSFAKNISWSKTSMLRRIPMRADHPQHLTKYAKQCINPQFIVLQGRAVPYSGNLNEEARLYYYKVILVLFKPWRSLADLKSSSQTWQQAFECFEAGEEEKRIIKNLDILHVMKEEAEQERRRRQTAPLGSGFTRLARDAAHPLYVDELGADVATALDQAREENNSRTDAAAAAFVAQLQSLGAFDTTMPASLPASPYASNANVQYTGTSMITASQRALAEKWQKQLKAQDGVLQARRDAIPAQGETAPSVAPSVGVHV